MSAICAADRAVMSAISGLETRAAHELLSFIDMNNTVVSGRKAFNVSEAIERWL
jgi:hypothetical protein